jgi:hypothetical protein
VEGREGEIGRGCLVEVEVEAEAEVSLTREMLNDVETSMSISLHRVNVCIVCERRFSVSSESAVVDESEAQARVARVADEVEGRHGIGGRKHIISVVGMWIACSDGREGPFEVRENVDDAN